MTPFFESVERVQRLRSFAALWVGTPFVSHASVRGAGVDCVNLAAAIYLECGALKPFTMPPYSIDGGQHNQFSQVIGWLGEQSELFAHVPLNKDFRVQPGDLLCFRFARSEHHTGIVLEGLKFIHAPNRRKVEIASLTDPVYQRCLRAVYRPLNHRREADK
jgi:cell wall-associated NlpC family hydrolase